MYDGTVWVHGQTTFWYVRPPICSFDYLGYLIRCTPERFDIPKIENRNQSTVLEITINNMHLLEDKAVQLQCCNQLAGRYQHWQHWHLIQRKPQSHHSFA